MNGYGRFGAMIATSTVVMFGLMYLNTYRLEDVFFSETRAYMALVMGAAMATTMLAYMHSMYRNAAASLAIFVGSAVVFGAALWLVRSQARARSGAVRGQDPPAGCETTSGERFS